MLITILATFCFEICLAWCLNLALWGFQIAIRCSRPCSRTPKSHENRGKSAIWFQTWKWPGNLRGTWSNEYCRFLTKLKSIYKKPLRTPYKLPMEIMKTKPQCPVPSGRLDAYIRKKHSVLLCFLVAGRRIELRTSWLWMVNGGNLWKSVKS